MFTRPTRPYFKKIFLLGAVFAAAVGFAKVNLSGDLSSCLSAGWNDNQFYRKNLQLDLQLDSVVENTVFKGIIRAGEDTAKTSSDDVTIREAYISQDFYFSTFPNSLNFKLGKQIFTWGNADELKPVDILNPQDYTYLSFKSLRERKIGVWSADLNFYFSDNFFIEAVWIPLFQSSDFSSTVFSFEQPLAAALLPDAALSNASYAGRIGLTLFDIDSHFIYFAGYDTIPMIHTYLAPPAFIPDPVPVYHRIEMYGFDFERALFSGLSVRGEAGYFDYGKFFTLKTNGAGSSAFFQDLMKGGDGTRQKKLLNYTVGFDIHDFLIKGLYINAQFNQNYIFDRKENLQQDEFVNLIALDLEYSCCNEKAKFKSRGFYVLRQEAYGINLETTVKISGNYEISPGAWIFEGESDSYYGLIHDKDFGYISAKVVF